MMDLIERMPLINAFIEAGPEDTPSKIIMTAPKVNAQEIVYGKFTAVFGGNFTRQMRCETCDTLFVEPTEKPYNCCPYCYVRRAK